MWAISAQTRKRFCRRSRPGRFRGQAHQDGIDIAAGFWESGIDSWTPECGLEIPDGIIDRNRNPRLSARAMLEW